VDKFINSAGSMGFLAMILSMLFPGAGPYVMAMIGVGSAATVTSAALSAGTAGPAAEAHCVPAGMAVPTSVRSDAPVVTPAREGRGRD
jgi:hypothetical protein